MHMFMFMFAFRRRWPVVCPVIPQCRYV